MLIIRVTEWKKTFIWVGFTWTPFVRWSRRSLLSLHACVQLKGCRTIGMLNWRQVQTHESKYVDFPTLRQFTFPLFPHAPWRTHTAVGRCRGPSPDRCRSTWPSCWWPRTGSATLAHRPWGGCSTLFLSQVESWLYSVWVSIWVPV